MPLPSWLEQGVLPRVLRIHDAVYQKTNGWIGHRTLGIPSLLLHTVGAKTGAARTASLTYARDGGEVTLFARREDGRIRLGVGDRGPGIAVTDLAEARRRFGRLESSRAPGGAGLGLALAEAVAHLHDGRLDLDDNRPGLRATLDLPLAGS